MTLPGEWRSCKGHGRTRQRHPPPHPPPPQPCSPSPPYPIATSVRSGTQRMWPGSRAASQWTQRRSSLPSSSSHTWVRTSRRHRRHSATGNCCSAMSHPQLGQNPLHPGPVWTRPEGPPAARTALHRDPTGPRSVVFEHDVAAQAAAERGTSCRGERGDHLCKLLSETVARQPQEPGRRVPQNPRLPREDNAILVARETDERCSVKMRTPGDVAAEHPQPAREAAEHHVGHEARRSASIPHRPESTTSHAGAATPQLP